MIYLNDGETVFTKTIIAPGITTENYEINIANIGENGFPEIIIGGNKVLIYKNK